MYAFRILAGLALCAAGARFAWSQDRSKAPTTKNHVRVVTNEIIVPVTVTDAAGEFVLDLGQKDFHVFDDGVEKTIDHWDLGGDPLAVALVIDTSSRLHVFAPVIHSIASIFTETVMALDGEAAVITYDSSVEIRQSFTPDHHAVEKAIMETKFDAPEMSLYDGMAQALDLLQALASPMATNYADYR
jgi:VWFA-related protein